MRIVSSWVEIDVFEIVEIIELRIHEEIERNSESVKDWEEFLDIEVDLNDMILLRVSSVWDSFCLFSM